MGALEDIIQADIDEEEDTWNVANQRRQSRT